MVHLYLALPCSAFYYVSMFSQTLKDCFFFLSQKRDFPFGNEYHKPEDFFSVLPKPIYEIFLGKVGTPYNRLEFVYSIWVYLYLLTDYKIYIAQGI